MRHKDLNNVVLQALSPVKSTFLLRTLSGCTVIIMHVGIAYTDFELTTWKYCVVLHHSLARSSGIFGTFIL